MKMINDKEIEECILFLSRFDIKVSGKIYEWVYQPGQIKFIPWSQTQQNHISDYSFTINGIDFQ